MFDVLVSGSSISVIFLSQLYEKHVGRFPISSNTLIIRTTLTVLESPPENCSSSSNSHVFFQTDL